MPDPADLIRHAVWRKRFDDEILAAAARIVGKVREVAVEAPAGGGLQLRATVAGEECEVDAWQAGGGWDFETSCSCEGGFFCPHAAALLLKLEKSGARPQPAPLRRAAELAPAAANESWPRLEERPRFVLRVSREPVDRQTRLLFQSVGREAPDSMIVASARVHYAWHEGPLRGSAPEWTSVATGPDGRCFAVIHDAGRENAATQQLRDTGLTSLHSHPAWRFILGRRVRRSGETAPADLWFPDPDRVPVDDFWFRFRGELAARLEAAGWEVTVDDSVGHRVFEAPPEAWNVELEGEDAGWFGLSVGFEVAGRRLDLLPVLTGLLDSELLREPPDAATGSVYVPLPGGEALRLPAARVRAILHHLAALLDPRWTGGRAKIHALDAAGLTRLEELPLRPPAEIAALAAKLRDFAGLQLVPPAAGIRATLRDYQLAGFCWMRFLADHGLHGILADDMGLGKTLQTLTHLLTEKEADRSGGKPSLVVAPTSVVPNWRAEAAQFAPGLRVLELAGAARARYFATIPHADLVLTSYALLQRDISRLAEIPFHLVVLDEAQYIKNPHAKVAQAACRLRAAHRLCLSGTPIENHLGELWSQMRFLMPGLLGSEDHFNTRYRTPIEKHGDGERNAALKRRVAPLILRRTKDQVATELPPKTELIHLVELHTAQKDLYETVRAMMDKRVRQAIAASGLGESRIVFLDALLKLRQICCHPRLLPPEFATTVAESAKLDFLAELLAVLLEEGRRMLVFSQFTSMLALIAGHLDRVGVRYLQLTGASKDRGALVAEFQSGRVPLFLISLKAGGTGLNLTAADTVIHYDPWWNPAAENQATDRAYRIGQDKPVFVHKLLCLDTVEERIHKLQQHKGQLAAGILAPAGPGAVLDPEAVKALLEP